MLHPTVSDRTVGMEPKVCGEVEGIEACGTEAGATGGVVDEYLKYSFYPYVLISFSIFFYVK